MVLAVSLGRHKRLRVSGDWPDIPVKFSVIRPCKHGQYGLQGDAYLRSRASAAAGVRDERKNEVRFSTFS